MKITRSSDWRDGLPFDTPMIAASVVPGEPTRCAACGPSSDLIDRASLWAVKHKHPNNPAGFVRFYCAVHVPKTQPKPASSPAKPQSRRSAPRAPQRPETPAALCPTCFVEVPASGVCGMCGESVA